MPNNPWSATSPSGSHQIKKIIWMLIDGMRQKGEKCWVILSFYYYCFKINNYENTEYSSLFFIKNINYIIKLFSWFQEVSRFFFALSQNDFSNAECNLHRFYKWSVLFKNWSLLPSKLSRANIVFDLFRFDGSPKNIFRKTFLKYFINCYRNYL